MGSGSTTTTQSALQRTDTPPQGIRSQFEFFQEGNGFCRGLPPGPPRALVEEPRVEIGEVFSICFPGFALHQPVNAEVRLPNGVVRRFPVTHVDTDGVAYWPWFSMPGDPLGEHAVAGGQGAVRGTGTFTVRAASQPGILIPPPNVGPPGTAFPIGIFGFPPKATVPVYVYRKSGGFGTYEFVTTLSIQVNAQGQTLYNLQTRADDPRGGYCFLHRGTKAAPDYACGSFSEVTLL